MASLGHVEVHVQGVDSHNTRRMGAGPGGGGMHCMFISSPPHLGFFTQAFYYCNNKQGDNTLPVHGFFIEGLFDNPISLTIKRWPA